MIFQASYQRRDVVNSSKENVHRLTFFVSRFLEFGRVVLLGWSYGDEELFFPYGSSLIRDGSEIRFSEDKWLDNATLCEQYSALYNIVRHKSDTVAMMLEFHDEI
jgi:hypothetical protein